MDLNAKAIELENKFKALTWEQKDEVVFNIIGGSINSILLDKILGERSDFDDNVYEDILSGFEDEMNEVKGG